LNVPNGANTPLRPIKWYKQLSTDKGRLEAGVFLVEGDRSIRQILHSNADKIIEIVTAEELPAAYRGYPTRHITDSQFRSVCHSKTPQGPLAVVRMPSDIYSDYLPGDTGDKVLLLEDVQDPGNVGTLIRTAAALDFSGVILSTKCADPLSPKCVQSTAGAVLSVWIRRTDRYLDLVRTLQGAGYPVIAADLNGEQDMTILDDRDKIVLALGNEASGLSDAVLNASDYRIKIPVNNEKAESLNVAVCGAICMFVSAQK
jgi:TrmH family RNA methyltransferase